MRAGQELQEDGTVDGHYRYQLVTRIAWADLQLPPTPKPQKETRTAHDTKFGAAPAAVPKTPAINNIKVKARRRPIKSPGSVSSSERNWSIKPYIQGPRMTRQRRAQRSKPTRGKPSALE